jgi:hypothetical protein
MLGESRFIWFLLAVVAAFILYRQLATDRPFFITGGDAIDAFLAGGSSALNEQKV